MDSFLKDIRYGIRSLLKRPGSTAIAVVTLALGIGANAAIFSFVDGLLLRPLAGVERPDRLVGIYTSDYSSGRYGASSYPDYLDFRRQADAFADLAAYESAVLNLAGDTAERLRGAYVTSNYFGVLGVPARLGRTLNLEDDARASANPVVVISHALWQRRFGADPTVVGSPLTLNNRAYTVIGVTAESFRGLRLGASPELWLPLTEESKAEARGNRGLSITGRLRDGVGIEQGQAQITAIADRLAHAYPQTNMGTLAQPDAPRPMSVVPEARVEPAMQVAVRRVTSLLLVVVGLVLLIACANVVNLLLARASSRRREIAIRLALGASRRRLIRQLLTESILLALIGGAAGLCVGLWTADLIPTFFPPGEASGLDLSLNWRVLGFTSAVTLLTGVLFGLAPALQASHPDVVSALKDEKSSHVRGLMRFGLRNVLVTGQIAISLVLLIGAGLFLRSLRSAITFDPGFEAQHLLLASLGTGGTGQSKTQMESFYQQLLERVGSQPGVHSVSLTKIVPLGGGGQRRGVLIEGYQPQPNEDTELNTNVVGPNYFGTLGIPVVEGRDFRAQDRTGSPGVVVVNEELARRYFAGQSAVGKRLRTDSEGPHLEIIGVVRTAKYRNLREPPLPFIYIPLAQEMQSNMTLLVRTTTDPASLLPAMRSELQHFDRNVPVYGVKTMTERIAAALAADRMIAVLLGIFGGAALLLAAVGLYGVMSYLVAQRTREIGIRMALGAQTLDVLRLVVKNGMTLALIGVTLGLTGAFALTRMIASLLFEFTATDAMTYAVVSVGLLLVALFACYVPARRATKVNPLVALRYE